ncbi:hypothetical protein F5Y05DRAFT_403222 [Hypoxylon sp. FL0543]|nr:hypothetical protein F5Y05DRAFT_403222 [Hypoxylon sp. FL0543]
MDCLNFWGSRDGQSGWKQAAKVNCTVLVAMSVTLISCLISVTKKVGGVEKALFFFDGACDGGNVSQVNMVLHLLINVISTLVVTSSNFFMQVLNSPSREELNTAHFKGSWMGIGIPSVRNAFSVSRFKTLCWICLLISSIPIHLLFNSTIFQTDQRNSDFHVTIATEKFLNGGTFYPPGGSLVQPGFTFWYLEGALINESLYLDDTYDFRSASFGAPVNLTDYADKNSEATRNISDTAQTAARWERLEVDDCKKEYISCSGLKYHRNLVLVVDKPGGWIRNDMWHLMDNQTKVWDRYIPADQPNHLFFNTQCMMVCHIAISPTLLLAVTLCVIFKTCTAIVVTVVLSRRNQPPLVTLGDAIQSFIEKPDRVTAGMCTLGQKDIRRAMTRSKAFVVPGPRQWQALKRRRGSAIPKSVWATSYLLFAVGITVCGFFLNSIFSDGSLYGSFFESEENSFIDMPITFAAGVLLANSPQLLLSFCYLAYNNLFTRLQMAREWSLFSEGYHALRVTDPKGDQYSTYRLQLPYKYSLPLIAISIFLHWLLSNTIYLFISTGGKLSSQKLSGYFGTDSFVGDNLIDPSLPPNTAIAVGYSSWSLLGLLVSSCVLVLVPIVLGLKRLPPNMVNVGSNSLALSAACHVSPLSHAVKPRRNSLASKSPSPATSKFDLPLSPQSPMRPRTVLAGEAYSYEGIEMQRLSPVSNVTTRQSSQLSLSSKRLLPDRERGSEDSVSSGEDQQGGGGPFTRLARSKIRWGVVTMPPEWHAEYDSEAGPVGHLSFGVEEDDVRPPEPGELYA